MASRIHVVNARVTIRSKLYLLGRIRDRLKDRGERCYNLFKSTIFGPWLDIRTEDHHNHVLNFLLFHQRNVTDATYDTPFIFDVGQHTIEMGRKEFCLITGFRFGDISLGHLKNVESGFMKRVFPSLPSLKGENLLSLLEDKKFKQLAEPDAVRVCLLLAADFCFMGQEIRHVMVKEIVTLVDDLDDWNAFPWGEHMWQEFHERNYMLVSKKRSEYMDEYARKGSGYQAVYNLWGFAFALKIFVLETFPQAKLWWQKNQDALPRGIAWCDMNVFNKSDYNRLFYATTPPQTISPTDAERASPWWISSLEYFDSPCVSISRKNKAVKRDKMRYRVCHNFDKKVIRTSLRIHTEVHTSVVDEGCSQDDDYSDVEVDESLKRMSKKELLKYVASMDGRLAAVEKWVKTAKVPVVTKETMEEDGDKIMKGDVEEEDVVKEHDELVGVKTAEVPVDVTKDSMEEDVDKNMKSDVDEEESMGEVSVKKMKDHVDGEDGVKEHMEDDGSNIIKDDADWQDGVKEHLEDDGVNIIKDDADWQDDVKDHMKDDCVKESTVEDAVKDSSKEDELMDLNYFSSLPDNMFQDTQIDAQQDLCSTPDNSRINEDDAETKLSPNPETVIDLDMPMDDGIKTVRVPFGRARKKGRQLCDPFTPPPPTTTRKAKKCRPRSRVYKSALDGLIGYDGSNIPLEPWIEELTRPEGAYERVVTCSPEITLLLRTKKELRFQLPWCDGDFYNRFWVGLIGKDKNKKGWLSDFHIDAWFMYLWHFRAQDADWVMVGPFFSSKIISRDIPLYYASGKTYGVPWCAENIEKVYFPINEPKIHWALGVLHIRSGVVTIYDSLHGPDDDGKPWWDVWMEDFAAVMPPYLEKAGVMSKKNIDPKSYKITFRYEENVPVQEGYYGDCGVWVCVFLYRLTHNMPLMVDDPAKFALAYREQLISFFWKYKKVISFE